MAQIQEGPGRPSSRPKSDKFWMKNSFREFVKNRRVSPNNAPKQEPALQPTPTTPEPKPRQPVFNIPTQTTHGTPSRDLIRANIERSLRESVVSVQPLGKGGAPPQDPNKIYKFPGMTDDDVNRLINTQVEKRMEVYKYVPGFTTQQDIEQKVRSEITYVPPGTTKEDIEKFVQKKVKEQMVEFQQPRQIYLADGSPIYISKEDERNDYLYSIREKKGLEKFWLKARYDFSNKMLSTIEKIAEPSYDVKELLTDKDAPNPLGDLAQVGLNSAILGWEYIRATMQKVPDPDKTQQFVNDLRTKADGLDNGNIAQRAQAAILRKNADALQKDLEFNRTIGLRIKMAERAVDASWEDFFSDVEEAKQEAKEKGLPFGFGRQQSIEERQKYVDDLVEEQRLAKQDAASFRTQAEESYRSGNYTQAIELTRKAQEADRLSDPTDPYGSYTWTREPERYEKFLQDTTFVELQKGSPLTEEEIRRIKLFHVNGWTEATGEVIFDWLNFLPTGVLDDAVRMPMRLTNKGVKALRTEFKTVDKALHVMGTPVRWLKRPAIRSTAQKMKNRTYNIFEQAARAYDNEKDYIRAVNQMGDAALAVKRAPTEDAARRIFELRKNEVRGLRNVTFEEFMQLVHAGDHVDPTQWARIYENALTQAEETLAAKGVDITPNAVSRIAKDELSHNFYTAYIDPHRILKGSRLLDDSIAGWAIKTVRNLTGGELNETLKLSGFDNYIRKYGTTLTPTSKASLKVGAEFVEASLQVAAFARDVWSAVVLTTPRWFITNLIDTSMRDVVHGGNLFDGMGTLFLSLQRTLADELGFVPIDFSQALSRADLDIPESITTALLYEGYKPMAGPFSYWKREFNRLLQSDANIAKRQIINQQLAGLPEGKFKNAVAWLSDGLRVKTPMILNPMQNFGITSAAISDFNTAIEFTFRLRMFHRNYFDLLKRLEPKFLEKGLSGLSPGTTEIATEIWRLSEGNPARVAGLVDSVTGAAKADLPAKWSFIVPPNIDDVLKGMDLEHQRLFVTQIRSAIEDMIRVSRKTGAVPTADDFRKFMTDYKNNMREEVQDQMSSLWQKRKLDNTISTDGAANAVPDVDDLAGSAPLPTQPRAEAIAKATQRLRRGKRFQKTTDIAKDFSEAISEYGEVRRVAGANIDFRDGVIEIGDDALKLPPTELYKRLHETVMDIFKKSDAEMIVRSGFSNLNEYDDVVQKFIKDPTGVLNESEEQFITIANQFTKNPQLKELLERTGTKKINFDSALDAYRNFGLWDNAYGLTRDAQEIMEELANLKIKPPGTYIAAEQKYAIATGRLGRLRQGYDAALEMTTREQIGLFLENWDAYRKNLRQVYAHVYPGPLHLSGDARKTAWRAYYEVTPEEYLHEAAIKNTIADLFATDPVAARAMIEEANADFVTYFLRENGVEITFDADKQIALNTKIIVNGKAKNFTEPVTNALITKTFYGTDIAAQMKANPLIRIEVDGKVPVKRQIALAVRNTFGLSDEQAEAWAKAMDSHAQRWAKETGRGVEEYYQKLGFQKTENVYGLAQQTDLRIVKRGAVQRTPEGQFVFYGLGQSNFESLVRESGELFWDDLVSMSAYSPKMKDDLNTIKKYIQDLTGEPVRQNHFTTRQSELFADTFARYVAEGAAPDIKLKRPFENFKRWLADTFSSVQTTSLEGQLTDDVYDTLNRLFLETKMEVKPRSNTRAIKLAAKEAGLEVSDEGLLKIINETLNPPVSLTPELTAQRQALSDAVARAQDDLIEIERNIAESAFGGDDQLIAATMMARQNETFEAERIMNDALKALEDFDVANGIKQNAYSSLADVPKDVANNILGTTKDTKVMKETQEAWDTWRTQRAFRGFAEDELLTPDTFKSALRERMDNSWSEESWHYNRMLAEVEAFEEALMNHHFGTDLATHFSPRVPDAQLSDGMRVFLRQTDDIVANAQIAERAIDEWTPYLVDLAEGKNPLTDLTKAQKLELSEWGKRASDDKAQMMELILNGGEYQGKSYEGAINFVNRVMLDYQSYSGFDQTMKNFFPFWMFPSRSMPFWIETMATHPQIIAAYEKIQRLSESQRYQAGAITSKGKPLPSYDGYIRIPGTDLWFNPLAPFSFRYLLDVSKSVDDITWRAQENEVDPKAYAAREMMETSRIFGFSVAPWISFLMKEAFNLSDESVPKFPVAPEISLIPRWMAQDMIHKLNQISWSGTSLGLGDAIYPEVSWHDFLVERRILEDALSKIRSGELRPEQIDELRYDMTEAIKTKDTALWEETYKTITNEEATRSWASFFTGLYAKPFTDSQAELVRLKNEVRLLQSAMNNEFQAQIFDLPVEADDRYENYINKLDSEEGWVYRLQTDIGWVKNESGELVADPKERARYLAMQIETDERQQLYHDGMKRLQEEYNERLRAIPIGASFEQTQVVYDWYQSERERLLDYKAPRSSYYTSKPVEVIQKDLTRQWMNAVREFAPRWEVAKGETYDEYQARVDDWYERLPRLAPRLLLAFRQQKDIVGLMGALQADQKLDENFFLQLAAQTTEEGITVWKRDNDDIFDALNNAWEESYWKPYWESGVLKGGYEADLAELDFLKKHPTPPGTDELFAWIQQNYGDKFSRDEVAKWVEESDVTPLDERKLAGKPADYQMRQDTWDMLSWIGPGSRNTTLFNEAFTNSGGDPDDLIVWYRTGGEGFSTQPEKLAAFHDALRSTMQALDLKPPSRVRLVEYVEAQKKNETFQAIVKSEFGSGFYDLMDFYYGKDKEGRKKFRDENPEMYSAIQDYYTFREEYAEENPVWGNYYGPEAEPSINVEGVSFTPPTYTGGRFKLPRDASPPKPDVRLPSQKNWSTTQESGGTIPYFGIVPRNTSMTEFPPDFAKAAGQNIMWEVVNVYSYNRKLSRAAVQFLRGLSSRHPEWSSIVENILSKGS